MARQVSADAYLTKPIHRAQLRDCLRLVTANSTAPTSQALALTDGQPALVTQHSIREAASRRRMHLLVAEDNIVINEFIVRMLEKLGCRAEVVATG